MTTEKRTIVLDTRGLNWATEKNLVEAVLGRRPGVVEVEANPVAQSANVVYDPGRTSVVELRDWVEECGLHCAGQSVPNHICHPMLDEEGSEQRRKPPEGASSHVIIDPPPPLNDGRPSPASVSLTRLGARSSGAVDLPPAHATVPDPGRGSSRLNTSRLRGTQTLQQRGVNWVRRADVAHPE